MKGSLIDMYLIDDKVYVKPFTRNGIIRDVVEHSNGEMYYDVELEMEGSSNGTHHVSAVTDEDLEYIGGYYN